MLGVVITDIHETSLQPLEELVLGQLKEGDRLIILGDYDDPTTVRNVKSFQQKYIGKGVIADVTIGNHDHAHLKDIHGVSYDPPTTDRAELLRRFKDHVQRLTEDATATAYLQWLVENHKDSVQFFLDKPRYGELFYTIALHGALDGSLEPFVDPQSMEAPLWYRLLTPDDHIKNFMAMQEGGFNVMLRGHDKGPEFAYLTSDGRLAIHKGLGDHVLLPDRMQTVTVGPYKQGHYLFIDTNVQATEMPIVSLRQLPILRQ